MQSRRDRINSQIASDDSKYVLIWMMGMKCQPVEQYLLSRSWTFKFLQTSKHLPLNLIKISAYTGFNKRSAGYKRCSNEQPQKFGYKA